MGKLKQNFSHSFDGKVWNIISHSDRELLLIEVRRAESFETSYHLLDTSAGKFLFKNVQFEESWWIGVSWLINDIIIFHTWPDQDNPDVRNYFAYDIRRKEVLWAMEEKNILEIKDSQMMVMNKESVAVEAYDIISGKKVEMQEVANDLGQSENKLLKKPFHYPEGTEHFKTVSDFIKGAFDKQIMKGVDYFENDGVIIVSSYFLNEKKKLNNEIVVVDHQGNPLMQVNLENDLDGISTDTFFIYSNKLIFVAHKRDFLIYQLP